MFIAFDPGFGAIKLYGDKGGLSLPSVVATAKGQIVAPMTGLRSTQPPLMVETKSGKFYVGENAHSWGRPVESLDFDRLTGSPEILALFYGALTRYGVPAEPTGIIVGLPVATLCDTVQQAVKDFLKSSHTWQADAQNYSATVDHVLVTSQPVGAMFDYLLTNDGEMTPDKRMAFKGEIGVLSIGMNTLELLVVSNGAVMQRFTAGGTLGVRRLLELSNHDGLYSLGELDAKLRNGTLDICETVPVWQSEVIGFLEKNWGGSYRRFTTVVVAGGGARILRDGLLSRFRDRAFIPDDPIISTARGLYKYTLMRAKRK
jgi:hypothetical protein